MVNKEGQRADDLFMRKIVWSLLALFVGQGGYSVYVQGTMMRQQEINTKDIAATKEISEQMTKMIAQMSTVSVNLTMMRTDIGMLTKEQRATSDKLIEIMPTVERASRHMDYYDHKVGK